MKFDELLLHPVTKYHAQAAIENKPQALLIVGAEGTGKETLAQQITCSLLEVKSLTHNPNIVQIKPENRTISIESIRQLREFLRRKTIGTTEIRRVIIIHQADTMGNEAQNALLKTLEEPPEDTVIIMTASDPTALRPTIRSRVQYIRILPVDIAVVEKYYDKKYEGPAIRSAYYMSDGALGLITALLEQANDHQLVHAIEQAKKVLQMKSFERLSLIDGLAKQKDEVSLLIDGLQLIARGGLKQAILHENEPNTRRFYALTQHVQTAATAFKQNGLPKLVLTDLFLAL